MRERRDIKPKFAATYTGSNAQGFSVKIHVDIYELDDGFSVQTSIDAARPKHKVDQDGHQREIIPLKYATLTTYDGSWAFLGAKQVKLSASGEATESVIQVIRRGDWLFLSEQMGQSAPWLESYWVGSDSPCFSFPTLGIGALVAWSQWGHVNFGVRGASAKVLPLHYGRNAGPNHITLVGSVSQGPGGSKVLNGQEVTTGFGLVRAQPFAMKYAEDLMFPEAIHIPNQNLELNRVLESKNCSQTLTFGELQGLSWPSSVDGQISPSMSHAHKEHWLRAQTGNASGICNASHDGPVHVLFDCFSSNLDHLSGIPCNLPLIRSVFAKTFESRGKSWLILDAAPFAFALNKVLRPSTFEELSGVIQAFSAYLAKLNRDIVPVVWGESASWFCRFFKSENYWKEAHAFFAPLFLRDHDFFDKRQDKAWSQFVPDLPEISTNDLLNMPQSKTLNWHCPQQFLDKAQGIFKDRSGHVIGDLDEGLTPVGTLPAYLEAVLSKV